jgi:hypothetical protein
MDLLADAVKESSRFTGCALITLLVEQMAALMN